MVSGDGRYIAFTSSATNLVLNDTNNSDDIFVRDRQLGTTILISAAEGGTIGNSTSHTPNITPDGRLAAFTSAASNLMPGTDTNTWDIYVRDGISGSVTRVSVNNQALQVSGSHQTSAISVDGRVVAFASTGSALVADDTNARRDIFIRNRAAATTVRVSVSSSEDQADNDSSSYPAISARGRYEPPRV